MSVGNQGEAIAPDVLPRLFDRFYRADAARRHPASDGAGLGLAWQHRQALSAPFASSFATLLTLKIALAVGVFVSFGAVAMLLRSGRMTPALYRQLHWAVLAQMLLIVLLAKAMFYLYW